MGAGRLVGLGLARVLGQVDGETPRRPDVFVITPAGQAWLEGDVVRAADLSAYRPRFRERALPLTLDEVVGIMTSRTDAPPVDPVSFARFGQGTCLADVVRSSSSAEWPAVLTALGSGTVTLGTDGSFVRETPPSPRL